MFYITKFSPTIGNQNRVTAPLWTSLLTIYMNKHNNNNDSKYNIILCIKYNDDNNYNPLGKKEK